MTRFPDLDAEWTDDYAWTRYRGPQAYPVPGDWVLNIVEGDGVIWHHYPDVGADHDHDDDVYDALGFDEIEDARGVAADLHSEWNADDSTTHVLTVDGETVIRTTDPEMDDLWAAVAEVLSRHSAGEDYDDLADKWTAPTAEQQAQAELERKQTENHGLGDFA